ncbi:STY4528 family pathogenicity island replication protein [Carnimonas bestiolae]|uniref:STY4528 family pathogenicity island replication protein n=1 Tax=Carnimonas bestiolae TaxID=3402172 RepID=UPI003EDC72DA
MQQQNLQALIGRAASAITQRQEQPRSTDTGIQNDMDGLLFLGNPHETVPRALLLDHRLGPVDKLAWQLIKLLSNPDGATAFPTYDQMQPLLGAGIGQEASRKTIARVIAILRLTRWLSLGMKARNTVNGRMIGNIYVLHDEPLAPSETMMIDTGYVEYVVECCSHKNTAVASVARHVREEMMQSGVLPSPTRIDVIDQRARGMLSTTTASEAEFPSQSTQFRMETQGNLPSSAWKLGQFPNNTSPSSARKLSLKSGSYGGVPHGNSYTTGSNTNTVCKNTAREDAPRELVWSWPLELSHQQREAVELMFTGLSAETSQAILDETAGRIDAGRVNSHPMGFIRTLAERASSGQFNISHYGQLISKKRNDHAESNVAPPSPAPKSATIKNVEETQRIRDELLKTFGIRR